jgi:hypothetical protein
MYSMLLSTLPTKLQPWCGDFLGKLTVKKLVKISLLWKMASDYCIYADK